MRATFKGYCIPRYRCALVRDRSVVLPTKTIAGGQDAVAMFFKLLAGLACEELHVAYLDTGNNVRGVELVARGGMSSLTVSPREVFRGAMLANAAAIIMAHNHPSQDPTPSEEDVAMTQAMAAAGAVLGITLLDHFVVCPERRTFRAIALERPAR